MMTGNNVFELNTPKPKLLVGSAKKHFKPDLLNFILLN